ncbi:MAG: magnesium/cobalt transporter CorA, partial [Pedobacter sp.]
IYIDKNALDPVITLHTYDSKSHETKELKSLNDIKELTRDKKKNYWIDIKGFNSPALFEDLEANFNLNKLVLEDVTRTYQRPKLEEYSDFVFAISRILYFGDTDRLFRNEQVSFILTKHILITLKDSYHSCFGPVVKRLEAGKGNIRTGGPSYLMYAIMDTIIDTYFKMLNTWGEELDSIEDRLLGRPDKTVMFDTQHIKRNIITIRRIAWPERDKLNDLLRSDSDLISEQSKMFIKDAYDHCIQIIDIIESLKEIAANNIDMYLSVISNRMNEIMKVLTIISSIFIPLTFVAGIYGMNFSKQDPVTGKIMPQNMPELYSEHGYLYTMIGMGLIAVIQLIYFWRRGWFK